jgi:Putative manganese efflux pump
MQQQSAATTPCVIDPNRPAKACDLRQRPSWSLTHFDGIARVRRPHLLAQTATTGAPPASQKLGGAYLVPPCPQAHSHSRDNGRDGRGLAATRFEAARAVPRTLALGTYHVSLLLAAAVIGAVSVPMSLVGLELGARIGLRAGQRGELLGGLVLIGVGAAIGAGII